MDFKALSEAALGRAETVLPLWLPDGRWEGEEWVALNPLRADRRLGSFKVNRHAGKGQTSRPATGAATS